MSTNGRRVRTRDSREQRTMIRPFGDYVGALPYAESSTAARGVGRKSPAKYVGMGG